jgi:hypothetical protein
MAYYDKYLKYKIKYLELQNLIEDSDGGFFWNKSSDPKQSLKQKGLEYMKKHNKDRISKSKKLEQKLEHVKLEEAKQAEQAKLREDEKARQAKLREDEKARQAKLREDEKAEQAIARQAKDAAKQALKEFNKKSTVHVFSSKPSDISGKQFKEGDYVAYKNNNTYTVEIIKKDSTPNITLLSINAKTKSKDKHDEFVIETTTSDLCLLTVPISVDPKSNYLEYTAFAKINGKKAKLLKTVYHN